MKKFFLSVLVCLFLLGSILPSEGHPHVFVDCRFTLHFTGDVLTGIDISWEFDSMFSSFVVEDHDIDHDGFLSKAELEKYANILLPELKRVHFFSYIRKKRQLRELTEVRELEISYADPVVMMKLEIPLNMKIGKEEKELGVAVYDEEYYIAFRYGPDNEVSQVGGDGIEASYEIIEDPDKTYYMGQIIPEEMVLYLRKR